MITETIYRFRVEYHDDLPEGHKAAYIARGIDPDNIWNLSASFDTLQDACDYMAEEVDQIEWRTWRIVDQKRRTLTQHKGSML